MLQMLSKEKSILDKSDFPNFDSFMKEYDQYKNVASEKACEYPKYYCKQARNGN